LLPPVSNGIYQITAIDSRSLYPVHVQFTVQ
jgi:hypothetical protein